MTILCLGVSHHTTPVELRERLAFSPGALRAALARFDRGHTGRSQPIVELVILSTCNRLELYARVQPIQQLAANVDHAGFSALIDFLAETRGIPTVEFESYVYRRTRTAAVRHLCRVAAGLDSMILGEPQILGQVTEAYEAALGQSAAGPVLSALFRTAIHAGKRARAETAISRNPASVSSVAVRLAEHVVGQLASRRVLVIGAGAMGQLAVEALRARGVAHIAVVSRSHQRAAELAQDWNGQAYRFDQLAQALSQADIVIASTGAPHTVIDPGLVHDALRTRADRPLVFIDIAVPRDVDPSVRDIPGAYVFDIDDLQSRLGGAIAERQREVPRVEAIVAQEVAAFAEWLHGIEVMPVIADLRQQAETIRQRELERTLSHLADLDPQTRERIERLSRALVNQLLHEPTLRLRAEASNGHAAAYAEAVRYLFGLER
ncbi:MAG TPA: glutamyl-tRNA reductase [Anaerolineae bacterium]|nr:glutamyl-tRNA reductase [Anaerolineae bacterium]